jgi:uroporphyrinogen III methyltransferase/synthase
MQRVASKNSAAFDKPLTGKRIMVTRARAQALDFIHCLENLGAEVVEFPTIEIRPPESFAGLDGALEKIERYDWLILTSVNGVEPFLSRLGAAAKSVASLDHLKVAAIGPQTAGRLEAAGFHNVLVPSRYQAEGILDLLEPETMCGKRVLIPRAAKARDVLPDTLRDWGAKVDVVEAYRTFAPAEDFSAVKLSLRQGKVDLISFTSSSTVRHFSQLFDGAKLCDILGGTIVACIGPITAKTVEELAGRVTVVAQEFTVAGLLQAIVEHFKGELAGVSKGADPRAGTERGG